MSRRPTPPPPPQQAKLTAGEMRQGIDRLKRRIADVEKFDPVASAENPSAATGPLEAAIKDSLAQIFGHDTVQYNLYRAAAVFSWPINISYRVPAADIARSLSSSKERSLGLLRQAIASLEERLTEEAVPVFQAQPASIPALDTSNREVFVVHGHDTAARESVARFLERAGFSPIILSEQTNKGRTLIEKFEDHSDVGFAVVLMTPDDVGGLPGLVVDKLRGRARQNVVLELGYFFGKLGRK